MLHIKADVKNKFPTYQLVNAVECIKRMYTPMKNVHVMITLAHVKGYVIMQAALRKSTWGILGLK